MVAFNTSIYKTKVRQFPGTFKINKITIAGKDFSDLWTQIDDFECIWEASRSAKIVVIDTQGMIATIPIIGEEKVEIDIEDESEKLTIRGRVYSITNRVPLHHGAMQYVVNVCSEEQWADSFMRVSKAYQAKPLSEIPTDMIKSPNYLASDKNLLLGEVEGTRSCTVNYWSPLHCCVWAANRATSPGQRYKSNFVFFETMRGFNWIAIDNLLDDSQNKSWAKLAYDPMRPLKSGTAAYDARGPEDALRFESLKVVQSFDTLENSRNGMYANKTRTIDIVKKNHFETETNYVKDFYSRVHLKGLSGAPSRPLCSFDMNAADFPEARLRLVLKHKGLFDDDQDGGSQIEQWMPQKLSQLQQLQNMKLVGILPGHVGLTAGMLVDLEFPNAKNLATESNIRPDETHSGQYLVTSLRRTFQRDRFVLTVELSKDSRGGSPNDVGI